MVTQFVALRLHALIDCTFLIPWLSRAFFTSSSSERFVDSLFLARWLWIWRNVFCFVLFTSFSRAKFAAFLTFTSETHCFLLSFFALSSSFTSTMFYNPRGNYVTWLCLDVVETGKTPKTMKTLQKHEAWRNHCSGKLTRVNNMAKEMIKNQEQERTTQRDIFLLFFILHIRKVDKLQRVLHKNAMKKSTKRRRNHRKKK